MTLIEVVDRAGRELLPATSTDTSDPDTVRPSAAYCRWISLTLNLHRSTQVSCAATVSVL